MSLLPLILMIVLGISYLGLGIILIINHKRLPLAPFFKLVLLLIYLFFLLVIGYLALWLFFFGRNS